MPLVLVTIVLPIVAGALLFLLPRDDRRISRALGTIVAAVTIVTVIAGGEQSWSFHWLARPFVSAFHFGATPLSFWIALLLTLSTACAIAVTNVPRTRNFVALMLLLEGTMLGLFLARDLLAFALFWDFMLIPVFFALTGWGEHPATAWRYFIYNFAGGLTLLLATAAFGVIDGTTDVIGRSGAHFTGGWAAWIYAGLAFAFLVKTPVWPLHTWMPPTYSSLPSPMVAVVSAVQSKAGLYGFIAIAAALMPEAVRAYATPLVVLGAISLIYGAVVALVQNDSKRIVAYSSLSHLGLIVIAIASGNQLAMQGALVYIIAHGLFSAALFLLLGYVEEREETRSLARLGGLGWKNPRLAGALCIAALAALGLPGLAGFAGELIILDRRISGGLRLGGDRRVGCNRPRLGVHAAPLPGSDERTASRRPAGAPRLDLGRGARRRAALGGIGYRRRLSETAAHLDRRRDHADGAAAMTQPFTNADWASLIPVSVLAIAALVVLIVDLVSGRREHRYVLIGIGLAGTIAAGSFAGRQFGHNHDAFFGGFVTGGFASVFEEVILIALAGSLILYGGLGSAQRIAGTTAIMMWSACGAMLMAGAANLMMIFLGLELLSLGLYALCAAVDRASARESALKYLILSSTATGFLLFGMALLFGATGSVELAALASPALASNPLFWMGAGMFLIGIVFKLSLVPFHTWTPDVFQGAPLPVTAFMSVATKAGTLAVFLRFIYAALPPGVSDRLLLPVWIIAGISMIVGNVGMLAQDDLKRLLGYSGVAQIGYILTGVAGGRPLGLRYAMYYLTAYAFMNLGAFAVAAAISGENEEGSRLSSYRGLARRRPWLAAMMTVFLLALAGLPPTAGFLGKILILASSLATDYLWLGVLLIIGTAISLYAYAKVVRAMYEGEEANTAGDLRPFVPLAWASAGLCALALVAMTFYPLIPSNVLPLVR